MNKRVRSALEFTELTLYTLVFLVVASGKFDVFLFPNPFPSSIFIVSSIFLIAIFLFLQFRFSKFISTPRTLLLTSLFTIIAVHGSQTHILFGNQFSPVIYFAGFMLLFANSGNPYRFIPAVVLSILWAIFEGIQSENNPIIKELVLWIIPSTTVFLFSAVRLRNLENEYVELLKEELMKQRFSVAENQERKQDSSTATSTDEDSAVLTDSMITTGKELDNLIFFIDKMYNPHTAAAFVFDKSKNVFILTSAKSKSGLISRNIRIPGGKGHGLIGELADDPKLFRSGDLTLYNRDLGYYNGNVMVASLLIVPILSRDHGLLGALAIDSTEKLAYRDDHVDRLSRFARIAGELIINVVMRKKQQQNAERFAMFYKSTLKFTQAHQKMNDVLDSLLSYIREIDDINRVTAIAWQQATSSANVLAVQGDTNEIPVGFTFQSVKGAIFHSAVENNKVEFVSDFRQIRQRAPLYIEGENINPNIASIMVVPFGESTANYQVVIVVESIRKAYFSTELRHTISTIIRNAASAYEKAFLYHQMEIQATTDGLTGLCNHRHFQENLHNAVLQSERYKRPLSLLLMDIDKFKNFNDTYGHQIGDLVLKIIAQALSNSVRSTDLAARYGGEEFVVVLPETDEENSLLMAERIRSKIESTPIPTEHGVLSVTVSIGSCTRGSSAITQEQLIKSADSAMYQSKKNGRNQVTAFIPGMENEINK